MKMKKNFLSVFVLLFVGIFAVTFLSAEETEAAPYSNATITNDFGTVINNSVINLQDNDFYQTNGAINGSPVIGRNITVYLAGGYCDLPKTIHYTKYERGFAIPFQASLFLSSIQRKGHNTYGIYTGSGLSFRY